MKIPILVALVALALHPASANADAVSDQKAAYKAMGMGIKMQPAHCSYLSMSEAAKFVGKPVKPGVSAGPLSGCAWRAADGSNDGLLVTRGSRDDWYPPVRDPHYATVGGVGEKAYTNYEPGLGYEAAALSAKGVTSIQFSGKQTAAQAIAVLKKVLAR